MSELEIQTVREGDMKTYPRKGNHVRVHYKAMFMNGDVYDDTKGRNQPFQFQIGSRQVIQGLQEIVKKMSLGQKVKATVPPEKAYGKDGIFGRVPGNASLRIELQLLGIS